MNKIAAITLVLLLVGCVRGEISKADNRVLCDAETKEGYYVQPGAGQVSFLRKSPQFDKLCNDGKTQ